MASRLRAPRVRNSHLKFVSSDMPGISRRRRGAHFAYYRPDGKPVRDRHELARLKRLAVPPAYTDVWICPDPEGHLQAVGRDERGRLQYRYHEDWRSLRDRSKYAKTREFGRALDRIRRQVQRDLGRPALDHARLCAAVVRLLDIGHIRVGNESYAKENGSYGATTLRDEHVVVRGGALRLKFKAKSGKMVRRKISDAQLARTVRRCHELPGHTLFCYLNGDAEPKPIRSDDVNAYLKDAAGDDFSAKHFRTWSGSVIAYETIAEILRQERTPTLKEVSEVAALALGNTPAICRSSYIHSALIARLKMGIEDASDFMDWPRRTKFLSSGERGFLRFLKRAS